MIGYRQGGGDGRSFWWGRCFALFRCCLRRRAIGYLRLLLFSGTQDFRQVSLKGWTNGQFTNHVFIAICNATIDSWRSSTSDADLIVPLCWDRYWDGGTPRVVEYYPRNRVELRISVDSRPHWSVDSVDFCSLIVDGLRLGNPSPMFIERENKLVSVYLDCRRAYRQVVPCLRRYILRSATNLVERASVLLRRRMSTVDSIDSLAHHRVFVVEVNVEWSLSDNRNGYWSTEGRRSSSLDECFSLYRISFQG